jgi:anti-anti-sigma factor
VAPQQPADGAPRADDGRITDLIAATDWSGTPIGPAAEWPQSLRTALSICLSSQFPMLVWWGPELVQFYNDAHLPAMGDKHPAALGQRAEECWAEAWTDIAPLADAVLTDGEALYAEDRMLFLQRRGYVEETYWTFSFSPIRDESAAVGGIFITAADTTTRVLATRRLQALRELGGLPRASAGTADEACRAAVEVLAGHRAELPATLTYLCDDNRADLRLVASTGTAAQAGELRDAVGRADLDETIHRVAAGGPAELSRGLTRTAAGVFKPGPTGDAPIDDALVLPIMTAGAELPAGVLVAAVSPYRELDTDYRAFFDLVVGHVATAVTDALAYQAERRRADMLAELDRVKTDFFESVSHEFRTPLTLIMGPLAELRRSPALADDRRAQEELDTAHRNSLRLGKLVNTLLDFARLQAGRVRARFEPLDLAALTAELASVFRSAVERAGLEYTVECPPLPEPVLVDRDMWEKIVLNLLSNAVKYTFTGRISVTLRADHGAAVLTVSDTGTGVPGGELPRLFERFHRAEGTQGRSVEGSGIGLAMVRELVGLHGGSITVDSAPGAGSTFTVRVPLGTAHLPPDQIVAPDDHAAGDTVGSGVPDTAAPFLAEALRWVPDLQAAERPDHPGSIAGGTTGGTVLIADDNADMREYLQRLLSPRHAVRAVLDGASALEAALADPPDLIVSDVMMPGMDGITLVAELRSDPRTAAVPVLLLSARAGQEAAVAGLASGADDYLLKPFVAAELLAKVDGHVRSGRVRREAERRFRTLADSTPAMIWVDGLGEQRVFVNRTWREFVGAGRADDWYGRAWRERIHPDDRDRHDACRADAQSRSEPFELEYRLRCADGRYRWVFDKGHPLGTPEQPDGYVGGCLDIDTRYRERQRGRLLARIGAALDGETTLQARQEVLLRQLVDNGLVDIARLIDVEDGRLSGMVAVAGRNAEEEQLLQALEGSWPLAQEVLITGEPGLTTVDESYIVAASTDPDQWEVRRRLGMHTVALIPLSARGRVVGLLAGARTGDSPRQDRADLDLLAEIGRRAATALDNAALLAAESEARRAAEEFGDVLAALSRATTPADVGEVILKHASRLGAESAVVVVRAQDRADHLSVLTASDPAVPCAAMPVSAAHPLAYAVRTAEPVWAGAPAAPADGGTNGSDPTLQVAVPLVVGGVAIGAIGMQFADGVPGVPGVPAHRRAAVLTLARQCAQALDRARLHEAEHNLAETLQRSLLPHDLPALDRLDAAARYMPGAIGLQAGGDWYDLIPVGETSAALVVGDVVGHGAAAAAVMGQLRSALAGYLLDGHLPAEALERLDRFAGRIPGAVGSTCACLVLDWHSGRLCWATAGHPPVLLLEPGGPRYLKGGAGPVLGLRGRAPYRQAEAIIDPGSSVVLYTDGLVERRGEVVDEGLARLASAAAALRDRAPDTLVAALVQEAVDDAAHTDDIALVAVRLVPAPLRDRLAADGSVLRGMRRVVEGWAAAAGLDDDATDDLQFALGEAAANAAEHAYPDGTGEFSYEVARTARGSIAVRVRDQGSWRPAPADRGHRGRGLQVIHALAENVWIDAGPEGTDVRFELPVRSQPRPPTRWSPPPDFPAGTAPRVLRVRDDLDLAGAAAARPGLLAAAAGPQPVVVDLHEVGYLSSSGVGLLTEAAAAAEEAGVSLTVRVAPGSAAERVLSLTGLAAMLPITS